MQVHESDDFARFIFLLPDKPIVILPAIHHIIGVNYIVYYLCRFFGIHYQICNVLAWIVAVTVAYFTNKIYVFESRSFSPAVLVREIILFAGARIFSLVCEMGFMWLTVDLMGGDDRIMKLIAAVFVVIINYVFSKLFIFKSNSNKEDSRK